MHKRWEDKEIELMLKSAKRGDTAGEASAFLKKNGYERTVTAIPLKYIHVTNYAWPVDRIEPAKKDSPLVYFQIGLMVIILGIIVMKVYV
tara:strand:+ start:93 stop:362 length:270 start_codon:yes stop_codon:yes gene_type:complete